MVVGEAQVLGRLHDSAAEHAGMLHELMRQVRVGKRVHLNRHRCGRARRRDGWLDLVPGG